MSDSDESLLSMTWNISEKITWALMLGMGTLMYWGLTAKIEDVAGDVCGCGDYIRQNARMIRQLSRQHSEVEENGNLPLDLNGAGSRFSPVDAPTDWRHRERYCDLGQHIRDCELDTRAKISTERRDG